MRARCPLSHAAHGACGYSPPNAEMAENFDRIADANAIPNLVGILSDPVEDLRREGARALGNLAANIEFGDMILLNSFEHLLWSK